MDGLVPARQLGSGRFGSLAAQEALWLAEQMTPGTSLRHVCGAWKLTGTVDVGILRNALQEVVRRHPVMSASIEAVDGDAVPGRPGESCVPLDLVDCARGRG